MTDAELEVMRTDWRTVSGFKRGSGEWGKGDEDEYGAAMKEAIQSGGEEVIHYWAAWLAREAEWIRRFTSMVRLAEQRIRAEMAAARERQAG